MDPNGGNEERLRELAARIGRLERHLGLKWVEPEGGVGPAEAPPAGAAAGPQGRGESGGAGLDDALSVMLRPAGAEHLARADQAPPADGPAASAPERADGLRGDESVDEEEFLRRQQRGIDWAGLELRVGQRWASVVGAVLFVIGMGLLFVVAWRRGWFGAIPPWARCTAGAAVGGAMLVAAEWVRGRVVPLGVIGLNAAGLGTVYVSAFAAYAMFHLLDSGAAFVLLSGVAVLGIGIAARSGFASVGVLSLLCGYATPFVIETANPSPWVLPVHLIVLLALATGLSAWKGPVFLAVRVVGQLATMLIGSMWALQGIGEPSVRTGATPMPLEAVLTLLGATWVLVHAEASRAVTRWVVSPDGTPAPTESLACNAARVAIVAALSAGLWVLAIGVVVVQAGPHAGLDYLVPVAVSAASGALAWRLTPRVRVVLQEPRTLAEQMSCVLAWMALGLLPAAVALAMSGWLRLAVWGAMAVVAAIGARRTRIWTLAVYGVLVLCAVTGQLVIKESWSSEVLGVGTMVWGIYFSRWMACMAIVAGAWLWLARLVGLGALDENQKLSPVWRLGLARLAAMIGTALVHGLWAHDRTQNEPLTVVMPVVTAALLLGSRWWPGLWVDRTATGGCLAVVAVWMSAYLGTDWLQHRSPLLLHPGLWTSLLAGGVFLLAGRVTGAALASPGARRGFVSWSWAIAGALAFISTSLEVSRVAKHVFAEATARSGAVSVWWAVVGIGLIVAGFAIRRPWPRRVGLGVLGLALAKIVVYDMAEVVLEWRAAAFIVLGLVMLGVGLIYARVAKKMGGDRGAG